MITEAKRIVNHDRVVELLNSVSRDGIDELLKWLEESDFFNAPASHAYHGSYIGGLCEHSLNVYDEAQRLLKAYPEVSVPEESVIIAALLHDLCKVNFYATEKRNRKNSETNQWESYDAFTIKEKFCYGGHGKTTEMLVTADMIFKWVNDEDPEDYIEVPWFVTGSQGDPSQALGSGLTYCTRYFLCNYFQIAQADSDVDAYRSKQKEAESSEDRAIAEEIISQFDSLVRTFLADNPGKSDEVKTFVKRYVKSGNYLSIKEPALAADLLAKFNEKFITK